MYVMKEPFTVRMPPDHVRLTALATQNGKRLEASHELRVIRHHTVNEYIFPMIGRWYVNAASSFQSHHRWRPAHEFALDLAQIGAGGSSFQGSGTKHTDYYAFGQDVVAVADGVVVHVNSSAPETDLPHPGEDADAFAERVLRPMWEKDPSGELAGGNAIIIRHANNEFSFYFHLEAGSVKVKLGERVTRGQVIAKVGMSGDGRQPHLHFQIGTSADPLTSQAIPIVFSNVRPVGFTSTIDTEGKRVLQTGEFVETVPPKP
jgi:murein DD-endopeptidase MepM/ murein hydrolase activator NlpD